MDPAPLLNRVLDDEGLTAGLDEPEATLLIRTLGDRVGAIAAAAPDASIARKQTEALCRRARQVVATALAAGNPRQCAAELRRLLGELIARPD
jgi:hypothetical protein